MLQRNTSGYPIELPTLGLGRYIHPGEDFDHEENLAGFTPVEELDIAEPDTSDTPGDEEVSDADAADGEPDSDKSPIESTSDADTSANTAASGAQPVGHSTDLPMDGADVPVGEPTPQPAPVTNQAPAVLPFATEEA